MIAQSVCEPLTGLKDLRASSAAQDVNTWKRTHCSAARQKSTTLRRGKMERTVLHNAEQQLYYLSGLKPPSCALSSPQPPGNPRRRPRRDWSPGKVPGTGTSALRGALLPPAVLRCPWAGGTHCAGSRAPGARPAAASGSPAPSAPAPAPPCGSPAGTARRQPSHRPVPSRARVPARPPRHLSDVLVLAERSLQRREHLAHRHGAAASRPRAFPAA